MKSLAAVLLCVLLAGCATPLPSPTLPPSPPPKSAPTPSGAPSPFPSPSIAFVCLPITSATGVASPPPAYCSTSDEDAVLRAVAELGYPVQTVTIVPLGFTCGGPFPTEGYACPLAAGPLPTAYVTFVGTDKVAALEIGTQRGGPTVAASVVAFEVPPAGWSMP